MGERGGERPCLRALTREAVSVASAGVAPSASRAWVVPSFQRVTDGGGAELRCWAVFVRHAGFKRLDH